jgi:hypothetical protein
MSTKGNTNDNADEKSSAGPRAFSVFLGKVADGGLHMELSAKLQQLSKALQSQAKSQAGVVKGVMTLKLNFTAEDDVLTVTYSVDTKEPKPHRPRTVFWQDKNANVVDENPKQLGLGLRDVSKQGPARDAGGDKGAARDA